jgi:hypothetical protein
MNVMHRFVSLILLAALLAGCASGGVPDDDMARFLVPPDKFTLYNCPAIAEKAKEVATRQRKLEQLMAKASADSGGRLVNAIAYRPDYLVARGEMIDLQKVAREKNCNFVPGPHMAMNEGEGIPVTLPPPPANRPPARAR